MSKFKIGDKVKFVDEGNSTGKVYTVSGFRGEGVTLEGIDNCNWWFDSQLELVVPLSPKPVPPLGLRPRYIVEGLRVQEILVACTNYASAGKAIPKMWMDELNELNARQGGTT